MYFNEIQEKQRRISKNLNKTEAIKNNTGVSLKFPSAYRVAKADQKTTDKGGKGRDPGWNPPRKKKEYCKNQTYCGERVHAGRKHADCDPSPTRPCGGPQAARGRIFLCFLVAPWLTFGGLWAPFGSVLGGLRLPLGRLGNTKLIFQHMLTFERVHRIKFGFLEAFLDPLCTLSVAFSSPILHKLHFLGSLVHWSP